MRTRLIALFLCAALLFSGCAKVPETPVTPPFFKVTDTESGGCVYLLGTMHVGKPNTVYPQAVYDALGECETLAVEIDLIALDKDKQRMASAMQILECSDKSTREMLGEDYENIRSFFEQKRLYNAVYEQYIPAVWSSTLTSELAAECGLNSELGTDRALLSYAKKNSISIHELETVEEQYMLNAGESEALQVYLLKSSVNTDWETQIQQTQELYDAWRRGDLAALERMLTEEQPPAELAGDYADFYCAMYESRQRKIADHIVAELENGKKTFVAVGALHFAAAPDILELLESEGYQVEDLA